MDNFTYMYNQNGTWHQPYFVYVLKRVDNDRWLGCRYNTNENQKNIYKPREADLENVKPKCHFDRIQYSNAWKYGTVENNAS